jgi:hypothetical protein
VCLRKLQERSCILTELDNPSLCVTVLNQLSSSWRLQANLKELSAENLTAKVASTVSEVTVGHNVDEHQTPRVPNDWPLQRVTVKDSKRIGMSESRWRGWILGVQKIVWSQVCVLIIS